MCYKFRRVEIYKNTVDHMYLWIIFRVVSIFVWRKKVIDLIFRHRRIICEFLPYNEHNVKYKLQITNEDKKSF